MSVQPSQDAFTLAREMVAMEAVMATILDETIPDGDSVEVTESGRTVCGGGHDIRGPLARFPTAVELSSCPHGVRGGTWHTHVTKDELRNPHNSLPDTANVIFGEVDVSAVVGTRSVEVVIGPSDPEAASAAFMDAIGAEVSGPDDVVDAIIGGRVSDPSDARSRVRRRMGSLFERHPVNFTDLDSRLKTSGVPASSPVSVEMHEAQLYSAIRQRDHLSGKHPSDPAQIRSFCRESNTSMKRAVPGNVSVREVAATAAISEAVSTALGSVL